MVHSIRCQFKICWLQETYIYDSSTAGSITIIKFDEQSVMGRVLSQQLVNHINMCVVERRRTDYQS